MALTPSALVKRRLRKPAIHKHVVGGEPCTKRSFQQGYKSIWLPGKMEGTLGSTSEYTAYEAVKSLVNLIIRHSFVCTQIMQQVNP